MTSESMSNQDAQLARLLATVLDVSLGTLWWIREDLWEESGVRGARPYRAHPDRRSHPGLSVQHGPRGPFDPVPLTVGFSGSFGPVVAYGLSKEFGPDHPTSFGKFFRPGRVDVEEFIQEPPDADKEALTGPWWRRSRITRNGYKPRLNAQEMRRLQDWLDKVNGLK